MLRCVTLETARKISMALRQLGSVSNEVEPVHPSLNSLESPLPWFRRHAENLGRGISGGGRPMVVGQSFHFYFLSRIIQIKSFEKAFSKMLHYRRYNTFREYVCSTWFNYMEMNPSNGRVG
jgi:hypothetical protein